MMLIEVFHSDYSLKIHEKVVKKTTDELKNLLSDEGFTHVLSIIQSLEKEVYYAYVPDEVPQEIVETLLETLAKHYHGWAILCFSDGKYHHVFSNDFGHVRVKIPW